MKASEFDGRVASMRQGNALRGYLFVTVTESSPREPGPHVLLEFLRSDDSDENTWFYSDRADPTDYDTAAELASSEIDWYGTRYSAVWLPDIEATEIKEHFERRESAGRKVINSVLKRRSGFWPNVVPDE